MLVLGRKVDEMIVIDDKTVLTVVGIDGDKVKLGFTAPPEVNVCRSEVYLPPEERLQKGIDS